MWHIPSEERRVIDELVSFWQSHYEPGDLVIHIDRLSSTWGSGVGVSFFRQVYADLRTNKRGKYAISSASEFKQFLETEYIQQGQAHAERQAQTRAQEKAEAERLAQEKAKEREELERRARADFDALGKEMAKATIRAELVELGRKRANLVPYTGWKHIYENVCWCCHSRISSTIHARCLVCGWYICSDCGSCEPSCNKTYKPVIHDEAGEPFLPDFPDE